MSETAGLIGCFWETFDEGREVFNHCIVVGCVIAGYTEDLKQQSKFYIRSVMLNLTLSSILNSSRIFANASARLTPEWDVATSTRSNSIEIDAPSCSKWTIMATYALWFGDVQASVAKFNAPSYSYHAVSD